MASIARKKKRATKAIAETVAGSSAGGAKAQQSESVVGRSAMFKALSPRQAYEQDPTVRTAVDAYSEQPAKCQRRLFSRRTGMELLTGPAVDWLKRNLTAQVIRDLTYWRLIEGERMVWKCPGADGVPQKLVILDPGFARPMPYQMNHLDLVTEWCYYQPYVLSAAIGSVFLPAEQVMFSKNFNPSSNVRGLSPLVTGALHASTNYYANRFNASFFQNGAHRDLVIRFPKGTSKATAKDFVDKWTAQHGVWQNNAFKVSAMIGDEFEIKEPGTTNSPRDGQFLELKKLNSEEMAGLLGVPALLMGNYAKVRYDSAGAEQESFFENRILPEVYDLSGFVQKTLVDSDLRGINPGSDKAQPKFISRQMRQAFERAMADADGSDYLFLLDPDHLPIAARLRASHLEIADKYRRMMGASFAAAAEWAGVDRQSNALDDAVYIDVTQQRIDGPALGGNGAPKPPAADPTKTPETHVDPDAVPEDAADEGADETGQDKGADKPKKADKKFLAPLEEFAAAYRSLVLESAAAGRIYSKQAALKLAEGLGAAADGVQLAVHAEFLILRDLLKADCTPDERLRAVKAHLNASWKRSILKLKSFVGVP